MVVKRNEESENKWTSNFCRKGKLSKILAQRRSKKSTDFEETVMMKVTNALKSFQFSLIMKFEINNIEN